MAALHAALLCCDMQSGTKVLASQDLYGATTGLLQTILSSFGVSTITIDFNDLDQVRGAAREAKPDAILAETISNPLLKVCDVDACADIAKEVGARLIIDNTFASPILCQPLQQGADIVVHSATKWLSGHADAMGGVVISRHGADGETLVRVMKLVGGVLSPYEAHQILRGTKTLAVRMERHCENAAALAKHLSGNPLVARVYYPGLESGEQKRVVTRILRAGFFGALVSIELADNTRNSAFRFMDALKLCIRSTSLGDVFTSVLHPASASHRDLPIERRSELGISEGLIRISVGIENINDIIADIEQALSASSISAAVSVPGAAAMGS